MQSSKNNDRHIDWARFNSGTREEINAEAAQEKKALGITGKYTRFRAHINGKIYEIPIPDVKALREKLHLSQSEFASRFHISRRTVQQWEQRRALPDMPARILLKAIELAPQTISQAAEAVHREILLSAKTSD